MIYIYLIISLLLFFYLSLPFIFRYSTWIKKTLIFMNTFDSKSPALSKPDKCALKSVRMLRLRQESCGIELGVWHILPESKLTIASTQADTTSEDQTEAPDGRFALNDSRPIVLYVHGNKGTRAGEYRVQLYQRLAYENDYHVITFDYRGYGDSTYESPSALGLTADARFMYNWLLKQPGVTRDRVIVWGHSLGTAVAVRMVSELTADLAPRRLVLESPFDTLAKAVLGHPYSLPFRPLPCFEYFFVDPISRAVEFCFDSAKSIASIRTTPIMILHAEDDRIVPHKLGKNLYETAVNELGKDQVRFISLKASLRLGHLRINQHNETMQRVKKFIENEA